MKTFFLWPLPLLVGCASGTYTFSFDVTDPGAIMFDVTNKTDVPLVVQWGAISIINPDRTQLPLHPDQGLGAIEPGAKLSSRLVAFVLPSEGAAAKAYDNTDFELVVPVIVRGIPRELRYHMHARATKIS